MKQEHIDILRKGAGEFGADLDDSKISLLLSYKDILLEWNEKMNLTAIEDDREFIIKHFVDSLSIIPYLKNAGNLIDVGTGAGFPGLPVKIAQPSLDVVLLDSLEKRTAFLKHVIETLSLTGISAIHSRAEDAGRSPQHREKYDVAVEGLLPLCRYCLNTACLWSK
mgnify:CR=1 FL=1